MYFLLNSYTLIMFLTVLSHFIMKIKNFMKYFKEGVLKYFIISMKFLNISKWNIAPCIPSFKPYFVIVLRTQWSMPNNTPRRNFYSAEEEVMFSSDCVRVCLCVCVQNISKSCEQILKAYYLYVRDASVTNSCASVAIASSWWSMQQQQQQQQQQPAVTWQRCFPAREINTRHWNLSTDELRVKLLMYTLSTPIHLHWVYLEYIPASWWWTKTFIRQTSRSV